MRVLIRRESFSNSCYELRMGKTALEFVGEDENYSLTYRDIADFCVTHDNRGKTYFTMLCGGRMYEGQVLDAAEIEPFIAELQEKLGGVINIEVKRS